MNLSKETLFILINFLLPVMLHAQNTDQTFAEKLGYPKGKKVLIIHVDDVGMSYESNQGAIKAIKEGVATSLSVMMPCGWVPGFVHYLKENPSLDAGLHLTLTSEWKDYRWGPLAGKTEVKGLVDSEGAMWRSVGEVVKNASADEVEKEIKAQLDRARAMGFTPTHLDSHMGTLFATPEFMERYLKLGIQEKIPVMFRLKKKWMPKEWICPEWLEKNFGMQDFRFWMIWKIAAMAGKVQRRQILRIKIYKNIKPESTLRLLKT
jgi:hypothetical protein